MFLGSFLVTLLGRHDVDVYHDTQTDLEAFYSCGDTRFTFDVTKYFTGPFFELESRSFNVTDGSVMPHESGFKFSKSKEKLIYDQRHSSEGCWKSIIVPSKEGKNFVPDTLTMVCIDTDRA